MDRWARWLLEDRFGGDQAALDRALASLGPVRDRVLDRAALAVGETVLDVGTGDGLIGFGALERLGETGEVIFTDVSADLLATCRRIATDAGLADRCRFVETSAEDLDGIADRSVDVVTTRSVLIYVEDKQAAFDAFSRVLRPGGRISLFEPINRTMQRLNRDVLFGYDTSAIVGLAAKVRAVFERAQPADSPMMNFDAPDLVEAAHSAGFHDVAATVEIELQHGSWLGPTTWQTLLDLRPNPNAPTFGDALREALTPEEQRKVEAHLRPRVEAGDARWFNVWCYLNASRNDDSTPN